MARSRRRALRNPPPNSCARVVAATLDDVKAFRTSKGGRGTTKTPVVVELRRRPNMDKGTFRRKSRDLTRLSDRGVLRKTKSPARNTSADNFRNKKIDEIKNRYPVGDPKRDKLLKKFGRKEDGAPSQRPKNTGYMDPDHRWELQFKGPDNEKALSWEHAYTQRKMGRDIGRELELAGISEDTPIIVKVIDW